MNDSDISIIEQYYIKVTQLTMFCCVFGIIIGFSTSTICKFFGYMKQLSMEIMIAIDCFIAIPEVLILIKKSKEVIKNKRLNYKVFEQVKIIMLIIIFTNYYIFALIQPSEELWYLAFFLAMIEALFLDVKYTIVVNTGLTISIIIVCILQPLEMPGKYMLWQDIFIRGAMSTLIMLLIFVLVYCAGGILLKLKEEKQNWLMEYLKLVESNNVKVREIKHNLNNQIIVLQSMINADNIEKANKYINKMLDNTHKLSSKTYCENIIINSILNSKINYANSYNINCNVNVKIFENIKIEEDDLGVIIGNLLDNAIEANLFLKDKKRKIDISIYNKNNSIVINIKNTKDKKMLEENTWKSDKKNHGIGLNSVKKLVNKYNGAIANEDKGDFYEVNIIIWQ
ncbi:GHKL domain-containing protein [Clostridium sp. LQ25]|uniref:sensor histidine kinase n=1 Tax=Clostridium sp. LQ25 TaxID=2992805 RepID=UPI00225AD2A6|nr:GHKL domain-containing protein [Clostridium sp. LQ25]UZT06169.1 GHKL domain-containing protein [Clostridium sp. LQ25]